jgi:Zn-dependent protease/CBS domain-containing protein
LGLQGVAGGSGGSFRLLSIFGFEIRIHATWVIILALVTWSLSGSYLPSVYPSWTAAEYWIVGLITALLFFCSVLVHELSHSFVARARGIPVQSITLFLFGGVSALTSEPRGPGEEFAISIVGPLTSFALGGLAFLVGLGTRDLSFSAIAAVAGYLAYINVAVGVFNLVPGFPLDGGRVLRAILWRVTGSMPTATRIAARVGQGVAVLIGLVGVWLTLQSDLLSGIWLLFIAWFLWDAARSSNRQMRVVTELRGLTAGSLADPVSQHVPPGFTVQQLANAMPLLGDRRTFLVEDEKGGIDGVVTLADLEKAPQEAWGSTPVRQVMTPRERVVAIRPETPAIVALQIMRDRGLDHVVVVEGNEAGALVTRAAVERALQQRLQPGARR